VVIAIDGAMNVNAEVPSVTDASARMIVITTSASGMITFHGSAVRCGSPGAFGIALPSASPRVDRLLRTCREPLDRRVLFLPDDIDRTAVDDPPARSVTSMFGSGRRLIADTPGSLAIFP